MIDKDTIPKHWEIKSLRELIQLAIGGDWGKEITYSDPGYELAYCIRGSEIRNWEISKGMTASLRKIKKSSIITRQLEVGDILVEISGGGPEQPVGRTVLIDKATLSFEKDIPKICTNFLRVIRPLKENDSKFLNYYLRFFYSTGEIIKYQGGSNNLRNLKFPDYIKINVPLPPLLEQQQIVSKIEELFSELGKGKQQLGMVKLQLKTYRQSVLKWAFEGRFTLTKGHDLSGKELPVGWKSYKLKDITLDKEGLRRGPFGSAIKKDFFVPVGYKVYEQGNAINNDPYRGKYFINEDKYNELKNFKVIPNDLIISCSGVTLGRICEIPKDAKAGIINQALLRIRLRNNIILNKYFIQHFRTAFFQKKIFDQSQGTAMPNLVGIKDFKEIEMLIPSIEEQQHIISEIETRLSVCDKMEETIENCLQQSESLRQSILKQAFEGKLVKPDENYN
jgi:type I restriction enzyme S subunit